VRNLPQYFIEDGVHRAVAARQCGLVLMPAVLYEAGRAPQLILVQLDQLHSPKRLISRSDPRHNYAALETAMVTITGRSKIPRISIQPLGSPAQPSSVPLAQVQISN
jgi:hypothetical protein